MDYSGEPGEYGRGRAVRRDPNLGPSPYVDFAQPRPGEEAFFLHFFDAFGG